MENSVVKSAARVIQIFEFFDTVRRECPVAEVADHYGWPHSSTSVLMRSLVTLGYLHYDSRRRTYLPSMRVAPLGDWVHSAMLVGGVCFALGFFGLWRLPETFGRELNFNEE